MNTALGSWLRRGTEPQILFPLLGLFFLLVIWGTTLTYVRGRHADMESAAVTSTLEIVSTYEAQVVRALGQIDQATNLVAYWHRRAPATLKLAELRDNDLLPPDLLFVVSIADREGVIIDSTNPGELRNVLQKDFFRAQFYDGGVYVGRPGAEADANHKLHFSRRLTDRKGVFDGAVIVSVDASYFVSGYETSKLGAQGFLGLLGTDGIFRVRRTGDAVMAGGRLDFTTATASDAEGGPTIKVLQSGWDGVTRWTSGREIYGFPLAVMAGLSVQEQFAAGHATTRLYLWLAALGSLLVITALLVVGRMTWQLAQSRLRESEIREAHAQKVEHLAYHDSLTGLPNRGLFSKLLIQGVDEARRSERPLAVAFVDLDGFKSINDTLGHDAGDELLRQVAARLKSCVRDSDCVARLGGDEFVILLPQVPGERVVAAVAEKILTAMASPFDLDGPRVRVTASIGIALCPRDGVDEAQLKKHADLAMYKAKALGKNNYQFYVAEAEGPEADLQRLVG